MRAAQKIKSPIMAGVAIGARCHADGGAGMRRRKSYDDPCLHYENGFHSSRCVWIAAFHGTARTRATFFAPRALLILPQGLPV